MRTRYVWREIAASTPASVESLASAIVRGRREELLPGRVLNRWRPHRRREKSRTFLFAPQSGPHYPDTNDEIQLSNFSRGPCKGPRGSSKARCSAQQRLRAFPDTGDARACWAAHKKRPRGRVTDNPWPFETKPLVDLRRWCRCETSASLAMLCTAAIDPGPR